jgi:hypothetical protein
MGGVNSLAVDLSWATSFFVSLSNFPPYSTGGSKIGTFYFDEDRSVYSFKIISYETAVTPVPAALPLFVTAVAGLGLVVWRQRRRKSGARRLTP